MHDPEEALIGYLLQDIEHMRDGFARMDDHRQTEFHGPFHLDAESLLLLREPGIVPVQVQTDFTHPGKRAPGQPIVHRIECFFETAVHRAGVQPHHGETVVGPAGFHFQHRLDGPGIYVGHVQAVHPRIEGPLHDGLPVFIVLFGVQMDMRIDPLLLHILKISAKVAASGQASQ